LCYSLPAVVVLFWSAELAANDSAAALVTNDDDVDRVDDHGALLVVGPATIDVVVGPSIIDVVVGSPTIDVVEGPTNIDVVVM